MNDLPQPEHPAETYIITNRWVRGAIRALLIVAAGVLLICADDTLLARLANWVSFVWPIATLYIVTLEPKFLAWVIERIRRAFEDARPKNRKHRTSWFAWLSGRNPKTDNRAKADEAAGNKSITLPENVPVSPSSTVASSETSLHIRRERIRVGPIPFVVLGALAMFALAGAFQSSRKVPERSKPPVELVVDPSKTDDKANSDLANGLENKRDRSPPPDASRPYIEVRLGDTCYGIAIACVGNGERFNELGSPANPWLDVSDRDRCLIRPSDKLVLPDSWPTDCVE